VLRGGAGRDDEIAPPHIVFARTTCRIGPIALTMAEPAGFVMNPCSDSKVPAPDGSFENAST